MASRKDEHKDETKAKSEHNDKLSTPPERKRAAEEQAALVPSAASIQHQQRQEIREAIVSAFDEAKENTQKAVKEAKRDYQFIAIYMGFGDRKSIRYNLVKYDVYK